MRGLVILVSTMSLLIVVGLGLVAYGVATKLGSEKLSESPALILPQGSNVTDMTSYKGNIALLVTEKGEKQIYVVNPKTGKALIRMPIAATGTANGKVTEAQP